jgi:outer membrane protein assembly factor BamE (lipoprotein component of BamABCDE complex)
MKGFICRLLPVLAAAWLTLALPGCDAQRIVQLEEGVSTEEDVRRQFGEPATVVQAADGSRTLEYPRQPEGQTNYFISIGADGKMSKLRQVLSPANFAKVQPGMDRAALRNLLGRPAKITPYELKKEEVWDWRWRDGQQAKVFSVTFDSAGLVTTSASADDPRETQGGGPSK